MKPTILTLSALGWALTIALACGDAPPSKLGQGKHDRPQGPPINTACATIDWSVSGFDDDDAMTARLIEACEVASRDLQVDIAPELEGYRFTQGSLGASLIERDGTIRVGRDVSDGRLMRLLARAWHEAD